MTYMGRARKDANAIHCLYFGCLFCLSFKMAFTCQVCRSVTCKGWRSKCELKKVERMNDTNGVEVGKETLGWPISPFWDGEYRNMFVSSNESTGKDGALEEMRDRKIDM